MKERDFLTPSSWELSVINEQSATNEVRVIHPESQWELDVAKFGK